MNKPGIRIDIPGYGRVDLAVLVTDYTGTLSCGGKLSDGVEARLRRLAEVVDIHVLTADTFGTVRAELAGVPAHLEIVGEKDLRLRKAEYVETCCDPARVAAMGNGNNDWLLLRTVKAAGGLALAVDNGEGCHVQAILEAHLLIHGAAATLDLLLEPRRLKAGLRC